MKRDILLGALLFVGLPIQPSHAADEVRYEAGEKSVYAFVLARRDLAGAQGYCDRLVARGVDAQSDEAAVLDDFRLLTIESTAELDFVHDRIFGHKLVDAWTWAGQVTYKGAPLAEEGAGLLFKDWKNPKNLGSAPVGHKNAFVCEMPTQGRYALDLGPLEAGEIRGPFLRLGTSTYAFQGGKLTFREASAACKALKASPDGGVMEGFELSVINSPTEHRRLHELVQRNGGAWTWAGTLSYPDAAAPKSGYAFVMTDPADYSVVSAKAVGESHAYICEAGGQPADPAALEIAETTPVLSALTKAEVEGNVAIYQGRVYVFLSARRSFTEAISRCDDYAREVEGKTYDTFKLVTLEDPGERQVVHELIRENGGRWTWAGFIDLEGEDKGDDLRRPVFTDFEDASVLSMKLTQEKHSYVCEANLRP